MKTTTKNKIAITSVIALLCVLLSSFAHRPGGDSFTISLNNKVLVQQYVHLKEKPKSISLHQASANDVVRIHYSHCGKMGIARVVTIKDQQSKTLKVWKFEDSDDGDKGAMKVQAGDIAKLQKSAGNKTLSLIYSSEQLPEGLVLANISSSAEVEASIK
jgi:hypothetical protein